MSLPTQTDLKIITRVWNVIEKQGVSIVIMGVTAWIFYSMMLETRKDIKDCTDYTRNVLIEVVERNTLTNEKVVEIVERLEDKEQNNNPVR